MDRLIALFFLLITLLSNARLQLELRPSLKKAADLAQFELDGSGEWRIVDGKLILSKAGVPTGPIRRPAALAILKGQPLSEVQVDLDLRSLAGSEIPRRDLDLVFGYQSPERFYYAHLSAVTDNVHNGIFLVDNSDRRRIDDGKGIPRLVDSEWHHVQLKWNGITGQCLVYFDSSSEPILSAADRSLTSGLVGVGSFDDTGEFRNIEVKGLRAGPR
ncbi:MAG TPA: hypothetical protein VLB68_21915 [Pyrinomonadaceae bacterium]|nr:hypothetical protein [Pyrinomonadaceae bacterium]